MNGISLMVQTTHLNFANDNYVLNILLALIRYKSVGTQGVTTLTLTPFPCLFTIRHGFVKIENINQSLISDYTIQIDISEISY